MRIIKEMRAEFIEKFCQVTKTKWELAPDKDWYEVSMNGCYLTAGASMEKIAFSDSIINLLIEEDIHHVYSTYGDKGVANYGFSDKNQAWYGWSHRGCCLFKVGSKVRKGDVAYMPKSKEDYELSMLAFWSDPDHLQINIGNRTEDGFDIRWVYSSSIPNERMRGTVGVEHCPYPKRFGKGEWTAENLDDARQMAFDYAENIG